MKISYNWLQSYIEEPLPSPEALTEKIIFGAFEVEETETLPNGDTVMDIKVLPDRAHDCLSHYGMAREVSGLLGLTLEKESCKIHQDVESDIKVTLESPVCRRYVARKVFGVRVGPSPEWLKERLEAVGQRSINNVVDATNYVMLSLGQPIHAFDYDKLASGHLVVRQAKEGESLTTLDGKTVALDDTVTVIADERQPLAIAGIKGGTAAEVDSSTKNIVIEVANFEPVAVRKTSKKIGIQNDSSKRFENEITPQLAGIAIHAITDLVVQVAGGQPEIPKDEYPNPVTQNTAAFSADDINRTLGTGIPPADIRDILNRYGYVFEEEGGLFKVTVPYARLDITGSHDMVEEVGRAYGYDRIVPKIPVIDFAPRQNEVFESVTAVKNDLVAKGYHEVQTYSFVKKGDFEVARGPVGKSSLRKNLADGLAAAYEMNKQNAPLLGVDEMKIFEVGTVFPKSGEEIRVALADKKGVQEMNIADYIQKVSPPFQGGAAEGRGGIGRSETEGYVAWSEYPFITRDIALWIPSETDPSEVLAVLKENSGDLSVLEPRLFDTFSKDGRTSVAFRLVFQSFDRTLTNDEVDAVMTTVYAKVADRGWEVR